MAGPLPVEVERTRELVEGSPMGDQVALILHELQALRTEGRLPQPAKNAIVLWSGVDDIQKRIEVTKQEVSALHARGVSEQSKGRATEQLRAVVVGTEAATDAILAAAEAIDGAVFLLRVSEDADVRRAAQTVADCVVKIFEACNFQDITGQRISKVVGSLEFIEERIASMVDLWKAQDLVSPAALDADDRTMLNGPALDGDRGVVSQDEVDALFR
ncbi:protein phosphatase CheZ [Acuticoccus sp.]|uniref:protein phosphatase CheZ n=1 Tax=Acuticoccus sp. TaxID=1904378 RepID=UPI003B517086